MQPTDQKPLSEFFKEGLDARQDGVSFHDNPYAAGSRERREWSAGFCATVVPDDGGELRVTPEPDKVDEAGDELPVEPDEGKPQGVAPE